MASDPKTEDGLFRSTIGLFKPAESAISLSRGMSIAVATVQAQSSFALVLFFGGVFLLLFS